MPTVELEKFKGAVKLLLTIIGGLSFIAFYEI